MQPGMTLILVDQNERRRAQISHTLAAGRLHVEPFESVSELARRWPRSGIILLNDEPDQISKIIIELADRHEYYPLIAFSENPRAEQIVCAILDGALDYLAWPCSNQELLQSLARVEIRAEAGRNIRQRYMLARNRLRRLTAREREVLKCVANGMSNRVIGETLTISPRTVEVHRANMQSKLGTRHTSEAIKIAVESEIEE